MLAVAPVTGLLKLYFGMTNLGGTRTDTVNKVVGPDGLDAVATPVVFSMTDIESLIRVQHPTIDTLVAAKTKEDLENAPLVPRRNFLSNSPFVLLPPFITKVLLENVSRDPETLFFLFLDAMKAFDAEHKDDADYAEAILESKNLLIFLWAAFRKEIPILHQVSDSNDLRLKAFGVAIHAARITGTNNVSPTATGRSSPIDSQVMQQLNLSVQKNTDLIERLDSAKESDRDSKKAKFDDLSDSSKNLILNASSNNGEVTPGAPNRLCAKFYSKKTSAKAKDFLQDTLTNTFNCIISLDHGMATASESRYYLQ